ncbi:DsbA family protein [uncultured Sphingomonas sp.]|uniref:DsbA family protein n=1 Tax=uncultured Sphingomonas sp. TaxID=158754 RepID=UPI0035CA3245
MKNRAALALLPLLVAGCNSADTTNVSAPATPVPSAPAPAGSAWVDTISRTADGGYVMGNPNAPLKIIEYGSRACPFCAKFDADGFPALKQGYVANGKVSYEFRDYPVHGALDVAPILLGHCIADPSTFFPLLDQMFANQPTLLVNEQAVSSKIAATMGNAAPTQVAVAYAEGLGYLDFVKARGIPEDKARTCLNDAGAIQKLADRTQQANEKYQVSGTPTFIVNGVVLPLRPGEDPWVMLETALKTRGA